MGHRIITGVEYLPGDGDGLKSAWLSDPDDFAGIVRAKVSFAAWHTVEVGFDFSPDQPPKCVEVTFTTSADGPDEITPADLREISLPDIVEKVSPVFAASPRKRLRRDVDTDRLRKVAEIVHSTDKGSEAVARIQRNEHVSRSRAYALIQQAREAGLITEGTEDQ